MKILDGFFRVIPENIGFASSDIFLTCSSSNNFRYHPQSIQYCIKFLQFVVNTVIKELQMVLLTSTVTNSNINIKKKA